mgnify:FL=1
MIEVLLLIVTIVYTPKQPRKNFTPQMHIGNRPTYRDTRSNTAAVAKRLTAGKRIVLPSDGVIHIFRLPAGNTQYSRLPEPRQGLSAAQPSAWT